MAVVVDTGTGMTKAGFAGDEYPRAVFPSVVGMHQDAVLRTDLNNYCVGKEARDRPDIWISKYPIKHGIVTNWDDMEKIWHHIFNNVLRVAPAEHSVLFTEAPLNPKANKEKMVQMMFESFDAPRVFATVPGLVSIYGTGRVKGLVLDCGEGVTAALSVNEGYIMPESIRRLNFAGRELTDNFMESLLHRGYHFSSATERLLAENIKGKLCHVALDYVQEMTDATTSSTLDKSYELPDGQILTINKECFQCPEALFQPSFLGIPSDGVHKTVNDSIEACEDCIRSDLYTNIILAGGSTMFPGIADRIQKEITLLAPKTMKIKVITSSERKYLGWIGASVLASLSAFKEMCTTKQEYDEAGPSIIHRKCF
ncbi:actin-3-like [Stegostoma tigrinum]|uniref:actin-3-like n=1 Tax=Stegostoma tigrinum TaxID=3053191 RepID=UPI00202AE720|nr:actin-3-like [Stegostoma tigrinum]XP_048384605.1 actin-3-like [Stegostoma tigrinum]XP_048384606.1 actin-3-like [Stegostoma tigrinum]XP_048384607.1 actin-3-like [Stegostoma tigrinum]XP_048384608.1 actin-3-like [Stegostoma tigrinum]XP_048384609.1 actin-3-like [Stegostoma tigrinum]XP_048384610.1 actin-3-like [Stegostoma tigrinum]